MSRDIFLGVGGSASSNIFGKYIFNREGWGFEPNNYVERQIVIVMSGVDSGGSVGVQMDLFNLNGKELNGKLHKRSDFPFQPHGDLKHFIIQSLRFRQPDIAWGSYFDFRSYNLFDHIKTTIELHQLAKLEDSLNQEFIKYLELFFEYFDNNKHLLQTIKPICLGNLLLDFWQYKAGNINNLSSFLKGHSLIPNWVEFVFLSQQRTNLQGRDINDNIVYGEHLFDEWQNSILPFSHKIHNDRVETCVVNQRLIEVLDNLSASDRVIIPPGSDSNWLGIINNNFILKKIKHIPVFWLTNLFRFASETSLAETLSHLNSLGLYPQVFMPNPNFICDFFKEENLDSLCNYVVGEQKIPQAIYIPYYSDVITREMSRAISQSQEQPEVTKSLHILEQQIQQAKIKPLLSENNMIFYEVEVKYSNKRYMHDRDYAEKWLESIK